MKGKGRKCPFLEKTLRKDVGLVAVMGTLSQMN